MFESIVFRNVPGPGPLIDIGALAEALLFYGRVAVIGNTATLKDLLGHIPPFVLLSLLRDRRLRFHYLSDQVAVSSTLVNERHLHDLITFSSPDHVIEKVGPRYFSESAGDTAQARIGARQFTRLLMPIDHANFDQASLLAALSDHSATDASAQDVIRVAAPDYDQAEPVKFRIERQNRGFLVDTNIDFAALNVCYHKTVSPAHSSMSEAYLLALIQGAYEATYFAATLESEVAVAPIESVVHAEMVKAVVRRRAHSDAQVQKFVDLTLANARAIREAVNSGAVPFAAILRLVESADKFRTWLSNQPPDADLLRAYYQETIKESWAEKLPTKTGRWSVFTGIGLAIDALGAGGLGTAVGLGISAVDAFVVDKLIKGWKPHQFVEGELKPAILGEVEHER